jgi:NTE family protein
MRATEQHHDASVVQTSVSVPISELPPLTATTTSSSSTRKKEAPPFRTTKLPPQRIALSGGGIRTIAHLGALRAWKEAGVLNCVKEYIGVSGGAFISLILCLGYTLDEAIRLCLSIDFSVMNSFDPENAFSFLETLGFDTGEGLESMLRVLLKHKGLGPHATFSELSDSTPRLRVYATNLTKSSIKEFSKEKTPDVELLFALRSSMSLPLYYTPVREGMTGDTYVDGGVLHNLPMAFLREEELHTTWGCMFSQPEGAHSDPMESVFSYMKHLYNSMLQMRYEGLLVPMNHRICRIPCGHISPVHFSATSAERAAMLDYGARAAETFLYGPPGWRIVRRNSVS